MDWNSLHAYGEPQVTEATYKDRGLIVRRTRLIGKQAELWPTWRYFGVLADLDGTTIEADQFEQNRAVMEHSISCNGTAGSHWAT